MPPVRYWTGDRIVEAVAQFIQTHGRVPKLAEFTKAWGLPDRCTVERRMRTCQEAIRLAQGKQHS